jgi:hypothetical protein
MRDHVLTFPDRDVVLVCSTPETLGRIVANTDSVAELRLARDIPGSFMTMDGAEQRLWSDDLARRFACSIQAPPIVIHSSNGGSLRLINKRMTKAGRLRTKAAAIMVGMALRCPAFPCTGTWYRF